MPRKLWWEEFEQATPNDGRWVKDICLLLETCWSPALNFSCSEVCSWLHLRWTPSPLCPHCCNMQGKTSRWLTCHGPSKSPHLLGNIVFWRGENLFKREEGWKGAEVCRCGTFSFAAEAAKSLENRSTGQITLFFDLRENIRYWYILERRKTSII